MNIKHYLAPLCLVALSACGSSSSSSSEDTSLYGNWMMVSSSGNYGEGLTLNQNGEYVALILQLTSDNSANVEMETGTFTVSSSSMTATPVQSSCGSTDPPGTYTYRLVNGSLEVGFPTGMIAFERNDAAPATDFVIRYGCFHNGVFTAEPLVSVK